MTTVVLLLLFSVTAMLVLVHAARGRGAAIARIEDLPEHTKPVDLEAFRNLMSRRDERYLRERLSGSEYRRVQRLRLRAGIEYVRRATANAAVLLRLGEAARRSPDPDISRAAQELVANAVMLRLMGFAAIVELTSRMLVPGSGFSVTGLIGRYEDAVARVALLGRLQAPAAVTRISTAL
jgi:hypothetical protein